MKYQNYLNNVLKLLQDYRDSVNGVKAIYDSDKAKHDRELKDMQGNTKRFWCNGKYAVVISKEFTFDKNND